MPPPTPLQQAAVELLIRLGEGEVVSGEEVYEILGAQDSIIIGDPETCRRKMERYQEAGVDRLMCLMQLGSLRHEHVMESLRLVGEHIIPVFSPK